MRIRKTNILTLAWRHVVCPLAYAADLLSCALFMIFLVCVFLAFFGHLIAPNDLRNFDLGRYAALLYGAWVVLVFSTLGPVINIARERKEVPLEILVGVGMAHLLGFIVIGAMVISRSENPSAITTLLASFAAAIMVAIGWVVQNQIGARSSRRTHTFNVFMQSRLSKEFQDHVRARISYYHQGRPVDDRDASLFQKSGLDFRLQEIEEEMIRKISEAGGDEAGEINRGYREKQEILKIKFESMQGIKYILNFYEFICAGILLKELDEPMIRETLSDIAVGLYHDTKCVRAYARTLQPKAYSNFETVVENFWISGEGGAA